ncbi:hypothetical protein MesoLjLc_32650 [Mesorhizobium sp. L-8-10]|uniref:DUF1868 domain-containing protein n=1 Tax=Mesorhizobium sp. L-8-10 TaxID=2744523 RepID=UPI001925FCD6|nr:DUF1868 domain-containing protein [Mesorhizobium sp. L-8-10]BCH31335.1 hypothetical protein MesoLjLc_32650 [Mesorhizobium sp. L-8-10]
MAYETNDAFAENFTEIGKDAPPRYLGIRFDATGTFMPTPGNTVVSHVVPGSRTEAALARVRQGLMDLPYGDRFAYTPVSSHHMTVFQGIIEGRRKPDYWPEGVALDAAVEQTTSLFLDRLSSFPRGDPFHMKVVSVTPLGLVLEGATERDEYTVRALRDDLVGPFGYRHPDHDSYTFHITMAYPKAWLPAGAEAAYLPALAALKDSLAQEIDMVELGAPAFCEFTDMTEFRPLKFLS